MVLAPTYKQLIRGPLRTFLEMTRRAGILRSFHKTEKEARLTGGRTVFFGSTSDPDSLRGPNLGWFWLDEAAMMVPQIWDLMIGRLRESPGRAWITTTPRGKNWVYARFVEAQDSAYGMVPAPTRSNTFNRAGFVESLESAYDPEFARQELEGEFLDDPSGRLILATWWDVAAILRAEAPERHDPIGHGPRRISADPSEGRGADPFAILVRDDRGILHLESDKFLGPSDGADRIARLRDEWGVSPDYISIDGGGGAGRDTATHLERHGIYPRQYFGAGKGGHRFFNVRALSAWRFREAMESGGFGLARAGAYLPGLKKEVGAVSYSMVGDKLAITRKEDVMKVLGHSPDLFDCTIQSFSYS